MYPEVALSENLMTWSWILFAFGILLALLVILGSRFSKRRWSLVALSAMVLVVMLGADFCQSTSNSLRQSFIGADAFTTRPMTAGEELRYMVGFRSTATTPILTTEDAVLQELTKATPRSDTVVYAPGPLLRTDRGVTLELRNFVLSQKYAITIPRSKVSVEMVASNPSVTLSFTGLTTVRNDGSEIGIDNNVSKCRYYWDGILLKCAYTQHPTTDSGTRGGPNHSADIVELINTHLTHATLSVTSAQIK